MEKNQYSARRIAFILLFLVALLRPQLSGIAYPFSQGVFLVPLLVGLGLVLLSADPMRGIGGWHRLCFISLGLLTGWMLTTLFWTVDPGQGAREIAAFLLNVLVFSMAFILVSSEKSLRTRWLWFTGFPACLVAIRALYQRFFGFDRLLDMFGRMEAAGQNVTPFRSIIGDKRVFAGFLNPNMLAGFLAVMIPFLIDIILTSHEKRRKQVLTVLVAVLTFVLLLTASIGGILAAGIMAMAVVIVRKGPKNPLVVALAIIAAALAVGAVAMRGTGLIIGPESSITQRIGYMAAGIKMATIHPVLGWGAGSTPGALMAFVAEGFRPVTDPHNFLIRVWIILGFPGVFLMLFSILSWAFAVSGSFKVSEGKSLQAGSVGLFFGSCAFILHSLMDMDFFVPETAFFGWWAMGAVMGISWIETKKVEKKAFGNLSWTRVLAGSLMLAAVLPSLIFFQGELTAFRADRMINQGDFEEAAVLYLDARELLPYNGRFALGEGRALKAEGNITVALDRFQTADRLMRASPYPPWEMGLILFQTGSLEESALQMERALRQYPTSPRIRIDLASVYLRQGDSAKAADLLRESLRYTKFDREAGRIAKEALAYIGK